MSLARNSLAGCSLPSQQEVPTLLPAPVEKLTVELPSSNSKCYFSTGCIVEACCIVEVYCRCTVEVKCRKRTVDLPRSLGGQTVAVSQVTLGPGQYFLSARPQSNHHHFKWKFITIYRLFFHNICKSLSRASVKFKLDIYNREARTEKDRVDKFAKLQRLVFKRG